MPVFERMSIPDVILVKLDVWLDNRGFFLETYHVSKYAENGIPCSFVQDNWSRSSRGVLRGLHFQIREPQAKLVAVLKGEIFDVAVDLRPGSVTFGQSCSAILSAENKQQLFVPEGFAHGFCVLTEEADVFYKCSRVYVPQCDRGVNCKDPQLNIDWPIEDPILSSKDAGLPLLADLSLDQF